MRIATWNVNSVRARLENIASWVKTAQPDVLLLQEIKCETTAFPRLEIQALGYQTAVAGQKSYNGVALLSRAPLENVRTSLPGDENDAQARYIEATIGTFRIASLYAPNGNPAPGEKFAYKLRWMKRLEAHVQTMLKAETPFLLGGDFNVIPAPEDVYDPAAWAGDALYRPETRTAWRTLLNLGLTDAFRARHPNEAEAYTFWDYQAGAWPRNLGLRIDHFLLSPEVADRLIACEIDREPRGKEKASDHTPLMVDIDENI